MKYIILLLVLFLISGCIDNSVEERYQESARLEKEIKTFAMSQDILIDGVSYRVMKVEKYNEIGETTVSQKADGIFYVIHLIIKNKGIRNGYFFSPSVKLIEGGGNGYYPDLKAKFYVSNLIDWEKVLVPGAIHTGVLIFDIPKYSKDLKLEIKNDWEKVEKIYITIPSSGIVNKDVMDAVVRARDEDELLKAGIN